MNKFFAVVGVGALFLSACDKSNPPAPASAAPAPIVTPATAPVATPTDAPITTPAAGPVISPPLADATIVVQAPPVVVVVPDDIYFYDGFYWDEGGHRVDYHGKGRIHQGRPIERDH